MDILFKREQVKGNFKGVRFKLWAKLELNESEKAVVEHYSFDDATLVAETQDDLMRKTILVGIAVFVGIVLLLWTNYGLMISATIGFLVGIAASYFYHDMYREVVYVKDLLHGRHFSCNSVIELARNEAWLERLSAFLRQVMESAKHWDGTEARPIEALPKEEAKNLIIRGLS